MIKIVEITEFTPEVFSAVQEYTQILLNNTHLLSEGYFRQILESDNSHLFLIFSGNNMAGMLTLAIYKSPTGSKGWIEDVVISDKYKGLGLGRKIVQHAIDYAKTSGIELMMLTSNPTRIAANKLYHSIGFEQKETNVYKMTFEK